MTTRVEVEAPVLERLSLLDRFLPVWIGAAMIAGLLVGRLIPELNDWLDSVKIGTVSLPIAVGLLAMMYPVLAKVRYSTTSTLCGARRTRRSRSSGRTPGPSSCRSWTTHQT